MKPAKQQFPNRADFDFWQACQPVPGWARRFVQPDPKFRWSTGRKPDIDAVIESRKPRSGYDGCPMHNMINFMQGWLRLGANVHMELELMASERPAKGIYTKQYTAIAKRWLRHMAR